MHATELSATRFSAAWSSEFLRLVRALMERVARLYQVRSDVREREKAREPQFTATRRLQLQVRTSLDSGHQGDRLDDFANTESLAPASPRNVSSDRLTMSGNSTCRVSHPFPGSMGRADWPHWHQAKPSRAAAISTEVTRMPFCDPSRANDRCWTVATQQLALLAACYI